MTGRLAELARRCLQNPNGGGAWYSSFSLHIYCKIIVKDKDGREIIIIRHAKSAYFLLLKFSKAIQKNTKIYTAQG
jgi:hypothetical protein